MQTGVDELWGRFVALLAPELRATASTLPYVLGLSPIATARWSEVFSHRITLAAPALLAQSIPETSVDRARNAALAHLLGVVDAFGTDRLEDGQIADTAVLRSVLAQMRSHRDAALARLGSPNGFRSSDERMSFAIREERRVFSECEPASRRTYRAVSLGKQSPAFPASLALAASCGWSAARRRQVVLILTGASLGLQAFDDAVDWEEDWSRGGAWAVCLARHRGLPRPGTTVEARRQVLARGTLAMLLDQSARWFRLAREQASLLGAVEVATWAEAREKAMQAEAHRERSSPGFVVRRRKLAPWAAEVLQC